MTTRRIFYGFLLLVMLAFHIFYSGAIAWYLLLITVLLPAVSLIITLPPKRKTVLSISAPESVNIGDKVRISVNVKKISPLPVSCVSFFFELNNVTYGKDISLQKITNYGCNASRIELPVRTDECGRIKCSVAKFRIYDYLGLFNRTYEENQTLYVNIFPFPEPPSPVPDLPIGDLMGTTYKPKPGGGFAEDYDIRGYRPGDPVNLIHWKLTSKRDDIMIREPLITERGKALLTFDLYGNPAAVGKTFSRLSWCVLWLLQYSIQPHILWFDGTDGCEHTVQIESCAELTGLMIRLFSAEIPLNGQTIAGKQYGSFVWRYHIGAEALDDAHTEVLHNE